MNTSKEQVIDHFVLVHGSCHGAWCWYKLKPMLESYGKRVTALDLSASGIDSTSLNELRSLDDYAKPLSEFMDSVSANEKVVLVGHSHGGFSLSLVMEKYPEKIKVAVFLAAFMPDYKHKPSYVLEQYISRTPPEEWLDTEFKPLGTEEDSLTSMFFGPKFVSIKLYQLCSPEDVELASMLLRPSSLFLEDLSKKSDLFSKERFGSVKRAYVVCREDKGIPLSFQRWQIESIGADHVMEIHNADHMPMLSTPQELCQCLLEIVKKV